MPSPFPGMNPYLEQEGVEHDFHQSFIPACAEKLVPQVRPEYIVQIGVDRYTHQLPIRDVERHAYLEIQQRESRQLITVVELLSLTTKYPGPNRERYLAKRRELISRGVHLVEIDLLRGGPRLPVEGSLQCDYCVLLHRSIRVAGYLGEPLVGLWLPGLRDPLPTIPIPLQDGHRGARLDLQQVLHRVYDAAGYEDYIYTGTPQPPLSPDDAARAQQFLLPRHERAG
jgi:hypothetical protein